MISPHNVPAGWPAVSTRGRAGSSPRCVIRRVVRAGFPRRGPNNLALLYHARDRYAEAEPLFQRSLGMKERALRPEHPDVATSLENYAALLRKTGRADEATEMEGRAKAIRARHAQANPVE